MPMLISVKCNGLRTVGLARQIPYWVLRALALFVAMALVPKIDAGNTIHVNTPNPGQTDGLCSLQEAIYSAEFGASIAITHTDQDTTYTSGCEPGAGNGDTIVLQSGVTYSFDKSWGGDAHNYMGPTATPIIFTNIMIEGNGAT